MTDSTYPTERRSHPRTSSTPCPHCGMTRLEGHHFSDSGELMRALSHVCHPGELIFDPFAGSGTTGVGALLEGRRFLGVEKMASYAAIARHRLASVTATPSLFDEAFDAPELALDFPAPEEAETDG